MHKKADFQYRCRYLVSVIYSLLTTQETTKVNEVSLIIVPRHVRSSVLILRDDERLPDSIPDGIFKYSPLTVKNDFI